MVSTSLVCCSSSSEQQFFKTSSKVASGGSDTASTASTLMESDDDGCQHLSRSSSTTTCPDLTPTGQSLSSSEEAGPAAETHAIAARARLKGSARPFQSFLVAEAHAVGVVPHAPDVSSVLEAARCEIRNFSHVADVQMESSCTKLDCEVVVKVRVSMYLQQVVQWTMAAAKAALVNAASCSESTYIIGYNAEPFVNLPDGGSFQAICGTVSHDEQDWVCWQTYETGVCPRPQTCRWCHPTSASTVKVLVQVLPAIQAQTCVGDICPRLQPRPPPRAAPLHTGLQSSSSAQTKPSAIATPPKRKIQPASSSEHNGPRKSWADMFDDEDEDECETPWTFAGSSGR